MKIQVTQDYSLFRRIKGNRILSQPHVKRLLEAIKDDPKAITYNPIIVNEKMQVIDGQHRLEAIKKLELPVHYVRVDDIGLATVQKLNSISKMWSPMDYAKSFAENGNEEYRIYIDFKVRFKFNHDVVMRYLALDVPMTGSLFKQGKFTVPNVARSYELATYLQDLEQFYERITFRNPAFGFLIIAQSPNYEHKHMLRHMKQYGHLLNEQPLANDYAREFERIYNYRQRSVSRLF
jgi:hypothetical protein